MFIGVTECGDPGLVFDWTTRLLPANIIISKNINDTLIKHVLANQSKIILHVTCTGLGGTVLEPNVPNYNFTLAQVKKLIDFGFPREQIVLRIDPIIPNYLNPIINVLREFEGVITRCRYSFLDMYPHVKQRFAKAGIKLPYESFNAPKHMQQNALQVLSKFDYEKYFWTTDLPNQLSELRGKRLGCYCKPLRCHGDFLAKLVNEKFGE